MSGNLDNSIAVIIQQRMIDRSLGTDPSDDDDWPIYIVSHPNTPDQLLCLYENPGDVEVGKDAFGVAVEAIGFQIKMRTNVGDEPKLRSIVHELDSNTVRASVTTDSNTYLIHAVHKTSPILYLGKEAGEQDLDTYSCNFQAAVTQTS